MSFVHDFSVNVKKNQISSNTYNGYLTPDKKGNHILVCDYPF